jgi:hypothetical protein
MQEKSNEQVRLFIRDQTTGRHSFNPEALRALGINPAEAQERGFQTTPRSEVRRMAIIS